MSSNHRRGPDRSRMDNKPGVGGAPQSKVASETKTEKDKVLIAVLGVTGAGKSTFINTATGLTTLKISHGSQPCTQKPRAVDLKIRHNKQERPIVLIDTPGFDDDKRSDVRILEEIATWMGRKGYVQLDGLIFMHPITFTRAGGSELNRTQLLEKILGLDAYNRVFIATTMWDYIVSEDQVKARLESRLSPGGVWHELTSKGASYDKHQNTQESAHEIIGRIVDISDRLGKPKILLETQLKERKGRVVATDVGMTLERQIQRRITLLNDQILKHSAERPPGSYRHDEVPEHKKAWKRWHRGQRELQGKLAYEEQQLRKLQNIAVRFFLGLTSLFGLNSFR